MSQGDNIIIPENQKFPEEKFDNMAMGQGVKNWQKTKDKDGSFACKDSHIKRYVEASRGREGEECVFFCWKLKFEIFFLFLTNQVYFISIIYFDQLFRSLLS